MAFSNPTSIPFGCEDWTVRPRFGINKHRHGELLTIRIKPAENASTAMPAEVLGSGQDDQGILATDSTAETTGSKADLPLELDIARTLTMLAEGDYDSFMYFGHPVKPAPGLKRGQKLPPNYSPISCQVMDYMLERGWFVRSGEYCRVVVLTGAGRKAAAEHVSKSEAQGIAEPVASEGQQRRRSRKAKRSKYS